MNHQCPPPLPGSDIPGSEEPTQGWAFETGLGVVVLASDGSRLGGGETASSSSSQRYPPGLPGRAEGGLGSPVCPHPTLEDCPLRVREPRGPQEARKHCLLGGQAGGGPQDRGKVCGNPFLVKTKHNK